MFYRDYHYIFDGWDEPPAPPPASVKRNEERLEKARVRAHENSPQRVFLELGLIVAAPLALALVVTMLLNAAGIPTGY